MKKSAYILPILVLFAFISEAQPPNDKCENAVVLNFDASGMACVSGTNIDATTSGELNVCKGSATREVWFQYVSQGADNTFHVIPQGGDPIALPIVSARNVGCNALTMQGCSAGAAGDDTTTLKVGFAPGDIVWVDVSAAGGLANDGEFELCVISRDPPPVPGNTCPEATILCNKNTVVVDDLNGLSSSGITPTCFDNGAANQDIWYKFTVGKGGNMEWSITPNDNVELDWAFFDITDGCPDVSDPADVAAKQVNCNFHFSGPGNADPIGMVIGSQTTCPTPNKYITNQKPPEFCPPHCFKGIQNVNDSGDVGRTFALMIENFNGVGAAAVGFTLEWGNNPLASCDDGLAFEIAPTANFNVSPSLGCNSLTTTVTDSSIASVSWDWNFGPAANPQTAVGPGPHVVTYNTCGTHLMSLTTISATGCPSVASQEVRVSCLEIDTSFQNSTCNQADGWACVTPTGDAPFTYVWPSNPTTDSCLTSIGEGTYDVIVQNADGCSADTSFTITSPGGVKAGFIADPLETTVEEGRIVITNTSLPDTGVTWQYTFGDASGDTVNTEDTEHTYTEIGTYQIKQVVRKNETECIDSVIVTIIVKGITTFYVPNAFTPQSDDDWNNTFGGEGIGIEDYNMWVYDRWGLLIWETDDLNVKWNGIPKNHKEIAPEDVYVWVAKFLDADGEEQKYVGHVSLIR